MVSVKCQICQKEFQVYPSWVDERKTCSKDCAKQLMSLNKIGAMNPMYGKKHTESSKQKMVSVKLGLRGKITNRWLGDKAGYGAIHMWVRKMLGEPDTCSICGTSGLHGKKIHWANKSGKYCRDKEDWIRLCTFCHRKYDKDKVTAKKLFKLTNCGYTERRLTNRAI